MIKHKLDLGLWIRIEMVSFHYMNILDSLEGINNINLKSRNRNNLNRTNVKMIMMTTFRNKNKKCNNIWNNKEGYSL